MSQPEDLTNKSEALPLSSIVEAYFQGTQSIQNFVVNVMLPVLRGQLGRTAREDAIVGTYYRIVGWLNALAELDSISHYQAVASGARSLFELLLDIKLIQSDSTGELLGKFDAFPQVERYRSANRLIEYCDRTGNTKIDCTNQRLFVGGVARKTEMDSIVERRWGRNSGGKLKYPKHWSGLSVPNRAQKLGSEYEALYFEFYPFLSWHMHSGSTGYAELKPETIEAAFGLMHGVIQRVALEATEVCAREMKMDKIHNLAADFTTEINELRNTTNKILLRKAPI
jgi:hypothetical protein